ncbi:hypothetical protein C8Q75DRAFT_283420 [Abortiporus biennis]|nr:hypothetical protein C8Q75DRAFT_283420 [Abortiporus biennis]
MPQILDAGVWITVDGKELEEYSTEHPNHNSVACYIPSEEGQRFCFKLRNSNVTSNMSYAFYLKIDGTNCGGNICPKGHTAICSGAVLSETTEQPFLFSAMQLTDDDNVLHSNRNLWDQIGVIEVAVCRVVSQHSTPISAGPTLNSQPMHELSKKAGSHRVTLGDPVEKRQQHAHVTTLETPKAPYAKFIFRYRPKALLQAQGIIPSPASNSSEDVPPPSVKPKKENKKRPSDPAPPSDEPTQKKPHMDVKPEKPESSTSQPRKRKKLAEMMDRLRALKDEINQVQAGGGDEDSDDDEVEIVDEPVKRETSPIRVPPPRHPGKKIIIDLTDD